MAKDWKGNSDSFRGGLAIRKDHTTKGRDADDFYATDPKALGALIEAAPHIFYPVYSLKEIIWEPACGTGNLSNYLHEQGYTVLASDLRDRGCGLSGVDFIKADPKKLFTETYNHPQIILTNPPYSLATEFIEHALEILQDGGMYIALMNITYLSGQKRFERVYSKGVLREVYMFRKRVECWRNNDIEQYRGKSMVNFAWYVFQKGYKGNPTLYWL